MPKLKQPPSLASLAMDLLVKSVVQFCDQQSSSGVVHKSQKGSKSKKEKKEKKEKKKKSSSGPLENVLRGVFVIKKDLHDRIPYRLLAGFANRLLDAFNSEPKHPKSSQKIALELIMDVEIDGLRCGGEILGQLDHRDVHRLRGLVELNLNYFFPDVPKSLGNFRLNNLTKFIHPYNCTDLDLRVIGDNCPKLQELKIKISLITDEGLRALSSCCELLVVDIWLCQGITDRGVIDLISAHDKLVELRLDHIDLLNRLDKRCPSMECLTMGLPLLVTDAHLHSIVVNFPNLTHLGLIQSPVADLTILKSLSKLEGIDLDMAEVTSDSDIEDLWRSLKELLTFIGRNIKTFNLTTLDGPCFMRQDGLNSIFESCPNIEYLKFDHHFDGLVIPPFQRLKVMIPRDSQYYFDDYEIRVVSEMKFEKLSNLESLSLFDVPSRFETVKSIILDHVTFPKLSELKMRRWEDERNTKSLEDIIKNNNLDLKIRYYDYISWSSYQEILML